MSTSSSDAHPVPAEAAAPAPTNAENAGAVLQGIGSSSSSTAELTTIEAKLGAATLADATEAATAAAEDPARAAEGTAPALEVGAGSAAEVEQAVEAAGATGEVEEVTEVHPAAGGGDHVELAAGWEAVPAADSQVYYCRKATDTTSCETPTPGSAVALAAEAAGNVSSKRVSAMFEALATSPATSTSSPSALHKWQHRQALAPKEACFKGQDLATADIVGSSQHAEAMRALQASVQAQPHEVAPPTSRARAVRALERKGNDSPASASRPSPPAKVSSTVSNARAALRKASEAEERAATGSVRQEAMRKLNAKGVVSTKQAFGVKSSVGSQHSAALAAFEAQGKDVKVGFAHKSSLGGSARSPSRGSAVPIHLEGSQASSARAAILARMQQGGA